MSFLTQSRIESVVLAGTGGFSLEVFDYLQLQAEQGGPKVAGFIDPRAEASSPAGIDLPFLGSIDAFALQPHQVVVVAIGSVAWREAAHRALWARGIPTPAFVAHHAVVSPGAHVAPGALICPFSIINREARLGEGVLVNVHCSVGHGAEVGEHSILSPYAALNGNAAVGARSFLGTRATIYPGIRIGEACVVDSHTGVRVAAADRHLISSRGQYTSNPLRLR